MKKLWPLLLILPGLFLVIGGFVFEVLFAGIPYQDPTPEMTARYDRNSMIASVALWAGLMLLMTGAVAAFYKMVRSGRKKR